MLLDRGGGEQQGIRRGVTALQVIPLGDNKNEHVFSLLIMLMTGMMQMMFLSPFAEFLSGQLLSYQTWSHGLVWFSQQIRMGTLDICITQTRKLTLRGFSHSLKVSTANKYKQFMICPLSSMVYIFLKS